MIESMSYHPERGFNANISTEDMALALKDERTLLWLDICDLEDTDIDLLTNIFNLHPLTVEDFIMPNVRSKAEQFPDYIFFVIFAPEKQNGKERNNAGVVELDCCLGKNFVITFHNQQIESLGVCKDRAKRQSPTMMHGADMLFYSILDACIDAYTPVISEFDNLVDVMSDELFKHPTQETLKKIYYLKSDIIYLRRIIGPQADMIGLLTRGENKFIASSNVIYYRNIYDNLLRLNDTIGALREVITGALEAYTSIVSNRLNEIMKTLTIITTIMMPLTLIASIYGMNFKYMPEIESRFGYPAVLVTMGVATASMLVYFKRRKWL
ncbi:MAG: magnesium/cobalt transporter CorA [Candidatus Omnitrophota bacterium]